MPAAAGAEPAPRPSVLDALFILFVCGLAFLLASTPARNSDLWLHLASGRSLVGGQLPRGTDPFASTTTGLLWVNHSWLSDALLYALYDRGEGVALVIGKAVLVTVLAGLLLCFRQRGSRLGLTALCAGGAVLALGPWLSLQPALWSLLGVVLTLYLLERPSLVDAAAVDRARAQRWLLVPLFALWANGDAWFLLGPVLVGLYALGEGLRLLVGGARAGEACTLALLTLASLAACLLTPYHYHTFAWPTPLGLSHAERALRDDPLGQNLVIAPFAAPFASAPAFASAGGWAYCLLLTAGIVSFGLCGRALHPGRLLVWLALAVLSLYQARAIPFFAVAAGPVLALNLQAWTRATTPGPRARRLQTLARCAGVLAGLALLVLAWPGWLQPLPYQPRAWTVERDESLVRMAGVLQARHDDQQFRPDRSALTASPEVAHYLAWFCPDEKGFLDSRWPLFDRVADDYVRMRRCLLDPDGADPALGALLDAHHVDRIILHDPDFARTTRAFRGLLREPEEWELLAVEGSVALFGRRAGPEAPSPWKPLDLRRAAYHPEPNRRALPPARAPEQPGLFAPFYRTRDDRSPDRAEAALHLIYFDLLGERARARLESQWLAAHATGLVGSGMAMHGARAAGALAARLFLMPETSASASQWAAGFLAAHDRGPPESLLLAVRAARRALSANPDDAGSLLLLGEAYLRLATQTRAQSWHAVLPALGPIRRAQALTALEQAALLRPDLARAHTLLAQLYFEQGQMDRALDHLRAELRTADERRSALRDDVATLEALVRRSEDIYAANIGDKTALLEVLERARLAARHGLTRKALEMLLESYPAIFGKAGTQMQLDLMLQAGRAYEVRDWLEPGHEALLGFAPYHSLRVQAAAACGDYEAADAELGLLSEPLRLVGIARGQLVPVREAVALRVGDAALTRPAPGSGPGGLAAAGFQQFEAVRLVGGALGLLRQQSDILVLRGLLALESGAVETARAHFAAALTVRGGDAGVATGAGVDFPTRPIAEYEMRLLE